MVLVLKTVQSHAPAADHDVVVVRDIPAVAESVKNWIIIFPNYFVRL